MYCCGFPSPRARLWGLVPVSIILVKGGGGSTLLWHKQTILSMFYMPTCRPSLSGVASVGFSVHVATHWVLMCCVAVVVGAWLSAGFRVVFLGQQGTHGCGSNCHSLSFPNVYFCCCCPWFYCCALLLLGLRFVDPLL